MTVMEAVITAIKEEGPIMEPRLVDEARKRFPGISAEQVGIAVVELCCTGRSINWVEGGWVAR